MFLGFQDFETNNHFDKHSYSEHFVIPCECKISASNNYFVLADFAALGTIFLIICPKF